MVAVNTVKRLSQSEVYAIGSAQRVISVVMVKEEVRRKSNSCNCSHMPRIRRDRLLFSLGLIDYSSTYHSSGVLMCRSLLEYAGAGLQKCPCSLTSFVSEEKTNTQGAELLIQNNRSGS